MPVNARGTLEGLRFAARPGKMLKRHPEPSDNRRATVTTAIVTVAITLPYDAAFEFPGNAFAQTMSSGFNIATRSIQLAVNLIRAVR